MEDKRLRPSTFSPSPSSFTATESELLPFSLESMSRDTEKGTFEKYPPSGGVTLIGGVPRSGGVLSGGVLRGEKMEENDIWSSKREGVIPGAPSWKGGRHEGR